MSQDFEQKIPVSPDSNSPESGSEPVTSPPPSSVPPPWISSPPEEVSPPEQSSNDIKEPIFKKLIPLMGIVIFGLALFFVISKVILPLIKKTPGEEKPSVVGTKKITLTYWGLWEAESLMNPIIADYQKTNPSITVNYSQQSYKDYRERLQSALARGEGPDIFRFHHSWMPMLKKDLTPAPLDIAQNINFSTNYYPVVADNLKIGSQIFGVPLGFDTLALFYNQKMFKAANKNPPTTWDELRRIALDLTVKDEEGNIKVGGIALGTTANVDNFSDILGLMVLQNGANLAKPTGSLAEDALKFYTLFTLTDKVWDSTLPNSTYAFAMEKVAMILAPSWRAHEITQINPNLEFRTSPVPQLPETKVSWATFWVEGVSAKSKNTKAAWDFLAYLSSKEVLNKMYTNASQIRKFGEPYPRKDLAFQLEEDPIVGAFVKQGNEAKSWYLCSRTFDNGINDRMIKYFEDAVNAVLKGGNATDALATAAQGVTQVLNQYGLK